MHPSRERNRFVRAVFCLAGLVAGVFLCGAGDATRRAAGAAPPETRAEVKATEPIPFPDGVTDPARHTAFVSSPKGGIQAIRLEDGKVLWTNGECVAEPWLVSGDRLIARAARLIVLDLKNDGKPLRQCDAPTYPKVDVPDRCTVSFDLWNPRVVGDALEANWYAVARIDRSKGRPFPVPAWTAFNKAVPVGTVKVNLATGHSEVQTDPKPADVTAGLVPEAAKPDRVPAGVPEKLAPVWQEYYKDQNGRITLRDGHLVGVSMKLEQTGTEYSKRIVLHSWDIKTGTAAEPVELIQGKALEIANVAITEDHGHVAVQFSTSALSIYSLADGKLVAKEVKGVTAPERAYVTGKRLYHVARAGTGGEQALKAIDLENGKVIWERALKPRNTTPLPP